jgi:hypothetical protein
MEQPQAAKTILMGGWAKGDGGQTILISSKNTTILPKRERLTDHQSHHKKKLGSLIGIHQKG